MQKQFKFLSLWSRTSIDWFLQLDNPPLNWLSPFLLALEIIPPTHNKTQLNPREHSRNPSTNGKRGSAWVSYLPLGLCSTAGSIARCVASELWNATPEINWLNRTDVLNHHIEDEKRTASRGAKAVQSSLTCVNARGRMPEKMGAVSLGPSRRWWKPMGNETTKRRTEREKCRSNRTHSFCGACAGDAIGK